jgi:hypothetical protein
LSGHRRKKCIPLQNQLSAHFPIIDLTVSINIIECRAVILKFSDQPTSETVVGFRGSVLYLRHIDQDFVQKEDPKRNSDHQWMIGGGGGENGTLN